MAEKANCRVCGKEFSPCKGVTGIPPDQQPFNWRKICCCVACGSQFINSVLESRGLKSDGVLAQTAAPAPPAPTQAPAVRQRRQAGRRTAQRQTAPPAEPKEAAAESEVTAVEDSE